MPALTIVSIPRSGRNFLANELNKMGITTEYQCVKTTKELSETADVVFAHDFNLDYRDHSRHILKLERNVEECLRSWFLMDVRQQRVEFNKTQWTRYRKRCSVYTTEFLQKYKYVDTIWFHTILNHPNMVLRIICAIIDKPFIHFERTIHQPRNLNIWPFV